MLHSIVPAGRSALLMILVLAAFLSLAFPGVVSAEPVGYTPLLLQVRIQDRHGKPVSELPLHFSVGLHGFIPGEDGASLPIVENITGKAATDQEGLTVLRVNEQQLAADRLASSPLSSLPSDNDTLFPTQMAPWFRGRVDVTLASTDPQREIAALAPGGDEPLKEGVFHAVLHLPSPRGDSNVILMRVFEGPDIKVEGFPIWLAQGQKHDRIAVVLEGFDPANVVSATDWMAMLSPVVDALRKSGISVMLVNFPDGSLPPDEMVPVAEKAIRAAAAFSGHKIALAGLSAGGIVGRWTLVQAEEKGAPLPVHTLLCLDAPNRGARVHPALMAIALRYAVSPYQEALNSRAAHVLVRTWPGHVKWKNLGLLPGLSRTIPAHWEDDTSEHDAFYNRLTHLNGNRGYPRSCRLIGVSSGNRLRPSGKGDLLHLWLPFGFSWTIKSQNEDHAPGSLLPAAYAEAASIHVPLGIAGAYMRSIPTFIPTESSLDAAPEERPPFDEYYVRPDDQPAIGHDQVDPGEGAFVIRALLQGAWE